MYNSRCQLARKCRCLIFIVKFQPLKLMMLLKLGKYMPDMVSHRIHLDFQSGPHATSKKNCVKSRHGQGLSSPESRQRSPPKKEEQKVVIFWMFFQLQIECLSLDHYLCNLVRQFFNYPLYTLIHLYFIIKIKK